MVILKRKDNFTFCLGIDEYKLVAKWRKLNKVKVKLAKYRKTKKKKKRTEIFESHDPAINFSVDIG